MVPYESSFKYEGVKTKIGSIGALGATHHPTEKMHHQILPISKVFVASNDRPVDGTSEAFLSSSRILKVTRLQGCTKTKL
jgi:hypothetical protein